MNKRALVALTVAVVSVGSLRAGENIGIVSGIARHLGAPSEPAGYLDVGRLDILNGEGFFVRAKGLDTYYDYETKTIFGFESIVKCRETVSQTFVRFQSKVSELEKATGLKFTTGIYKRYTSGLFAYDFASVSNATGEAYVYCHFFKDKNLGMVQWGARRPLPRKRPAVLFGESYREDWSKTLNAEIDARIEKYRKGLVDVVLAGVPSGTKVRAEQVTSDFQFGCNIFNFDQFGDAAKNAAYRDLFGRGGLFNAATVPFYWKNLEPQKGKPRYCAGVADEPDYWKSHGKGDLAWRRPSPEKVLEFCAANGVSVHGHVIIYPWFHPAWVNAEEDMERRMALYTDHIREIAKVYGDTIPQWDVVNESVDRSSTAAAPHDTLPWCGIAQPEDYTFRCFRAAAGAFPASVRLCINDAYTGPSDDGRYPAFTRKLIREGARIDVIGHQMHIFAEGDVVRVANGDTVYPNHISWRVKDQLAMLRQYDEIGRPVHVSEVTIPAPVTLLPRDEAEALQARVLRDNYRLWFSWPSVYRITYWNAVDSIGGEILESGFLRRDMTRKPVYDALRKLVQEDWRTRTEVLTEQGGRVRFRGFKGSYRLTWTDAKGDRFERIVHTNAGGMKY